MISRQRVKGGYLRKNADHTKESGDQRVANVQTSERIHILIFSSMSTGNQSRRCCFNLAASFKDDDKSYVITVLTLCLWCIAWSIASETFLSYLRLQTLYSNLIKDICYRSSSCHMSQHVESNCQPDVGTKLIQRQRRWSSIELW